MAVEGGLRASKRQRTRDAILANSIALFRRQGIQRTRTAAIAQAAEVSQATLFNYFPTKSALAEAWIRGDLDAAFAEAEAEIEERGARPALRAVCRRLAGSAADAPALRSEAWRSAGRIPGEPSPAERALARGLVREQSRGRLRADLGAETLAEALLDALEGGLAAGLRRGEDEAALVRSLMARVDLVLDGARKKNERVRAPAATSAARAD